MQSQCFKTPRSKFSGVLQGGRRGHHSAAVTVQALLQVTQSPSTQELQPNLAPAVINDKSCSFLIYKHLDKWWGVSRGGVQFQRGSLKKKKKTTQQKLSRGVNDALFAVPSTPAVVLWASCNLRTSSLWLVPILNRKWIGGKAIC